MVSEYVDIVTYASTNPGLYQSMSIVASKSNSKTFQYRPDQMTLLLYDEGSGLKSNIPKRCLNRTSAGESANLHAEKIHGQNQVHVQSSYYFGDLEFF